jgi:Holliday junction resolvase YEN1
MVKDISLTQDRLINTIGCGERIALSKLAITYLERTARPVRIAVDISIWLFQVQAGRGGQNPELRTLFFRLVRLLALPIHPLFVYDGKHKPPFKRGKATSRSYGSAPIINLSKTLIDLFKFPRHDAPGEAEAECARLQQAGVVDAVMSNDVDALMFGSTLTVMNFSKESSNGSGAATHVDCYRAEEILGLSKNVGLSRAGMILFAMLSGGDYLPSGVAKCGSKLAGEIAKAGFGEDLIEILAGDASEVEMKLADWRDRLQYELHENESGYFQSKHKAVKIPDTFPDPTILSFYASPTVSSPEEIELLRTRLTNAWDHEIDALQLRWFVADTFNWKYRSGAQKVVRNLAEPLVCSRLRLRRSVVALRGYGSFVPNSDAPILQRVYKSRMHYSTDGLSQLQLEIIPIDVVGLDLDAEEPNPPPEQGSQQEETELGDEDEVDVEAEPAAQQFLQFKQPRKRYNPYEPEKIWIFESVAKIGIPDVVERWKKQQDEKAAPKKPAPKKTTTRKKKPIDPGMKPGGILRFTTVTKPSSEINPAKQSQLLEATMSKSSSQGSSGAEKDSYISRTPSRASPATNPSSWRTQSVKKAPSSVIDDLAGDFMMACSMSDVPAGIQSRTTSRRLGMRSHRLRSQDAPATLDADLDEEAAPLWPTHAMSPGRIKVSYTNVGSPILDLTRSSSSSPTPEGRCSRKKIQSGARRTEPEARQELEAALESLSLTTPSRRPRRAKRDAEPLPRRDLDDDEKPIEVASEEPEVLIIDSSPVMPENTGLPSARSENASPTWRQKVPQQTSSCRDEEEIECVQGRASISSPISTETPPRGRGSQPTPKRCVESIRTQGGFWTVETPEEDTLSPSTSVQNDVEAGDTAHGGKDKTKSKKKIGRVSLLDLS